MKKIISFALICLYALGVIGGIGYTLCCGAYLIALGVAALGWMAWPKVVECWKVLNDGNKNDGDGK